jgi:hypothetical protein
MKVFLAWSGHRSFQIACTLREWLPTVIQAISPFMSTEDIRKGARWASEISQTLAECQFGILCMTDENLRSEWIHFEAGALSKVVETSQVTPLLIGLSPPDVVGPLAQFQHTDSTRDDMFRLLRDINACHGESRLDDRVLEVSFDRSWPDLEVVIADASKSSDFPETDQPNERTERSMIEELLDLARDQSRRNALSAGHVFPSNASFWPNVEQSRSLNRSAKVMMQIQQVLGFDAVHSAMEDDHDGIVVFLNRAVAPSEEPLVVELVTEFGFPVMLRTAGGPTWRVIPNRSSP